MVNRFEQVKKLVYQKFPKEFHCHLQFVLETALNLQQIHGGDLEVIKAAAIAHDFGRQEGQNNDNHPQLGAALIEPHLQEYGYSPKEIELIKSCIAYSPEKQFRSIEEEIVYNADQASKILHHNAFMLMVKKETWQDRARWGLKYIDRLERITFPDLKEKCLPNYQQFRSIYLAVLDEKLKAE